MALSCFSFSSFTQSLFCISSCIALTRRSYTARGNALEFNTTDCHSFDQPGEGDVIVGLARQFLFEGLVSVAPARGEATDGPVHWPSHLHLLGHLCKPHHQLDKRRASREPPTENNPHVHSNHNKGGAGRTHQGFLVVVNFGIDADDHSDFPLSVKVVLEQMGHFGVSVGDHLSERSGITDMVHQET
ncbi:hypothetical protein EYF80_002731 [Liparis tanakae]|uniref:Uncharacterized protein n=1 Tax=Liparis tanakae TaxID=230148 RepID=A0A4Z2J9S5_9TELE|nr:hypothetical protein EYF80_002731 [Liparis tanakae]